MAGMPIEAKKAKRSINGIIKTVQSYLPGCYIFHQNSMPD